MTIAQIRNQIHQLQRKFAKELAVYRLRQLADEIAEEWEVALAEKEELPQPLQVVRRVADTGMMSHSYLNLHKYVEKCREAGECLLPHRIVLALLPWAWDHRYDDLLYGERPAL